LSSNITKKLDANDYSFAHLTLMMLLHYLVKCKSRDFWFFYCNWLLPAFVLAKETVRSKAAVVAVTSINQ